MIDNYTYCSLQHFLYGSFIPCKYIGNNKSIPKNGTYFIRSIKDGIVRLSSNFSSNIFSVKSFTMLDGSDLPSEYQNEIPWNINSELVKQGATSGICINNKLKTLEYLSIYDFYHNNPNVKYRISVKCTHNNREYDIYNFLVIPKEIQRDDVLSKILGIQDDSNNLTNILSETQDKISEDQILFKEFLGFFIKSFEIKSTHGYNTKLEDIFLGLIRGTSNKKEMIDIFHNVGDKLKKYLK